MSKKPKDEAIEDDLDVVIEDEPQVASEKSAADSQKDSHEEDSHEEEADEQSDPDETEQEANARRERNAKNRQSRKERRDKAIAKDRVEKAQMREKLDRLEKELARVKDTQSGWQLSTYDQAISEEEKRINQIKAAMAATDDKTHYVDLTELLSDTKDKIKTLKAEKELAAKKAVSEDAPKKQAPKQDVDPRQQRLVKRFVDDNPWFDANSSHPDCQRTLEIDTELTQEGYNPKDEDYWEELTDRLKEEIPHRFSKTARKAPVTSTRDEAVSTTTNGATNKTYLLSRERKQAIIDAGAWDDLESRNRMIRAYQKFDKEERMRNL